MVKHKQAFTLIELLVVVLIIGILAAVAVPQYQKAVLKSRLTQVMVSMNALQKALDVWVLANGHPEESIRFWGENAKSSLDIDFLCESIKGSDCMTKSCQWSVACGPESCFIDCFATDLIKGGNIALTTREDGRWKLYRVPGDDTARKVVCQWWISNYGTDRFYERVYGDPKELCSSVGIQ